MFPLALPDFSLPPGLGRVIARLPARPPSLAFTLVANRLLWPELQKRDWQPLRGRRYAVHVKDLGLTLRFTLGARGFAPAEGKPDLAITATARDFLLLVARREDPDTLFFSRRLVSEGDTELGLLVKNLLDALDPEAALHHLPAPLSQAVGRLLGMQAPGAPR
jgi:predicted lipid carrier protein YhbT